MNVTIMIIMVGCLMMMPNKINGGMLKIMMKFKNDTNMMNDSYDDKIIMMFNNDVKVILF